MFRVYVKSCIGQRPQARNRSNIFEMTSSSDLPDSKHVMKILNTWRLNKSSELLGSAIFKYCTPRLCTCNTLHSQVTYISVLHYISCFRVFLVRELSIKAFDTIHKFKRALTLLKKSKYYKFFIRK